MSSRKRMTVFTSPTTLQVPTGPTTPTSPIRRPSVRYRVEERTRTIYVTSDVSPSGWDSRNLGSLFPHAGDPAQPVQRTRSKTRTEYIITEDTSDLKSQPRSAPAVLTTQRSRQSNPPSPLNLSPNRSPREPRPRILFYHKDDPYYGFTNFSPHPVKYKGKVYPTSEHLFQSFKVSLLGNYVVLS
jgi:diaminohydroxyphosphoribosylaminopyrimidine deaminase/5-amino-6-(5-phosphoribosylamino)uracil reductase